ncbi:phosphodiester glycosidase family protein [Papillibacter cinnamivorans]|uniref:S-layer homology domain-containing protein n=1 Tax=Papillibacter cinnamivorans DSM 12816 TaxID=1122930 RepID=A0A1W2A658_9FIRM|nr:phosphodiester glycosidase family protein [Papillibacter cinnamivorans]SMC56229.1 S-layer homology domain-containing protein [Papillibacter cinnamivorans DSM 12816]
MLKKTLQRAAAAVTALAFLVGTVFASDAIGSEIHTSTLALSENATLATGVFWSSTYSDQRVERYIEYTPNSAVTPVVTYGNQITDTTTLTQAAGELEAQGKHVVGGVNGDFYVVASGIPLGLVVTDGIIRSGSSYHWAVGFNADGTAFISIPKLTIAAQAGGSTFAIADINKARTDTGGIYLFNSDFNDTTGNTQPGVDVIITPTEGSLSIGGTVSGTVDQVLESAGAVAIPEGKIILSVNLKSAADQVAALRALLPGETVSIAVTAADSRWNNVQYATGALYQLVSAGTVVSGLEAGAAPRTALGIKADGTAIFYTIDGRQSGYSIGATLAQVAQRLIELGCVEAVCLDGGGSTAMAVNFPDTGSAEVINKPSDGSERAVSTQIFLVSSQPATGVLDHFYLSPYDSLVLTGGSVQIAATSVDTAGYGMGTPAGLFYSVSGGGSVTSAGLFTAGADAGISTVTAFAGGKTGTAVITAVKTPDSIAVSREGGGKITALKLAPGDTVSLTAAACIRYLPILTLDSDFTWSADASAGTVDQDGTFTAAAKSGSGNITVSAGDRSVSIPVTVKGSVSTVEGFEQGVSAFGSSAGMAAAAESGAEHVKYGYESAALTYDTAAAGTAGIPLSLSLPGGYTHLSLWVYGDGSGNTLILGIADIYGNTSSLLVTALNFTGWKQVSLPLPSGTASIASLGVIYTGASYTGTIWLDQITASNEDLCDTEAPVIDAGISAGQLNATLSDTVDTVPLKANVAVTYDGDALSFTYSESTGILTAALPAEDGNLHRITVTARDKSGNVARKSLEIPATDSGTDPFTDMPGHWAELSTIYLYRQSVVSGITTDAGLTYQPDKSMTRSEFAMILYKWLKTDGSDYSTVTLPFADASEIPAWALDAVKATYSMGILKGSKNNGVLTFNPSGSISRAEAMTLIGRTLERGYAEPELTFQDSGSVPSWSLCYVKTLVSQQVVNGYNNEIFPNNTISRGEVAKILYSLT